jgi:hypothetical protein
VGLFFPKRTSSLPVDGRYNTKRVGKRCDVIKQPGYGNAPTAQISSQMSRTCAAAHTHKNIVNNQMFDHSLQMKLFRLKNQRLCSEACLWIRESFMNRFSMCRHFKFWLWMIARAMSIDPPSTSLCFMISTDSWFAVMQADKGIGVPTYIVKQVLLPQTPCICFNPCALKIP